MISCVHRGHKCWSLALWIAALALCLAACKEEEKTPASEFLADLKRRAAILQSHLEKETGHELGEIEILVRSREELIELAVPDVRAALARIENGPRGEALEAEARASAAAAIEWAHAMVDRKGRILFVDPEEERRSLLGLVAEMMPKPGTERDPRRLEVIILHELVHVHQYLHLEAAALYESVRSRADILARGAVLEGHVEYLSRKIAPALGLAEFYERWFRARFESPPWYRHEYLTAEGRVSAADLGYAYVQGREFVAAQIERFGQKEAMRRIFEDPPSLAEVSRPEEYAQSRVSSPWGPVSEDSCRWLARERGEADLDVIALPMVREVAGGAARGFREGFRLRVDLVDVVIHVLIADSEAGARTLHEGWTRGIERLNALKVDAERLVDLRETRRTDAWVSEYSDAVGPARVRRSVVREGRLVVDVECRNDSVLEEGAERLARRALRFLRSPKWRVKWLQGDMELLESDDEGLRLAAVTRLKRFAPDKDWEVRWTGRFYEAADESKGEEARIESLVAALEDPHPAVVVRALRAFRDLHLLKVPDPLLREFLVSPEAAIRREAWHLLEFRIVPTEERPSGRIFAAEALKLVSAALDDEDFAVRVRAVECLDEISDEPEFVVVIRKALANDRKRVRECALITLSVREYDLPELVPDLVRLLDDDPENAAEVLGNLGEAAKEALPHLREKLDDPEARAEAAEAIWRISGDTAPLFEQVRDSVAKGEPQGIAALGDMGAGARSLVPEVARVLSHDNRWVRKGAAEALGEIGGDQARKALEQRRELEKDKRVLLSIRKALKRLDPQAESD